MDEFVDQRAMWWDGRTDQHIVKLPIMENDNSTSFKTFIKRRLVNTGLPFEFSVQLCSFYIKYEYLLKMICVRAQCTFS